MATPGSVVLGPNNPKELGEDNVPLYPCDGAVLSVTAFATQHLAHLHPLEQRLIEGTLDRLPRETEIPSLFRSCLTRSADLRTAEEPALVARRSGARSAYLPELSIKLKGCRPSLDDATYPIEHLPFDGDAVRYARIPFGVLRAEGAMREVLAWSFHAVHGLPVHGVPVAVFEYRSAGTVLGYCLALRTVGETRIEAFVRYPQGTVGELLSHANTQDGVVWNSELGLHDVNLWWYAEEKSRLLSSMHLAGGFRGVLNSNIGNDVLITGADGSRHLFLCDFDTFHVIDVAPGGAGSRDFLEAFVRHALVEVVKGSLSILTFPDLSGCTTSAERGAVLGRTYFERSSIWRAYERRLLGGLRRLGWRPSEVEEAIENAVRSAAFVSVVEECVLNSHYLEERAHQRGVFYPHN